MSLLRLILDVIYATLTCTKLPEVNSIGLSLIVWTLCGLFSALGAYCYAELGVMIRKSGGDYAYIMEAFGPFMAFIRLWVEAVVVRPCTCAVVALTCSIYLLQPLFPYCDKPNHAPQLLAAVVLRHTGEFENSFAGSTKNPGNIAMAFYSGLFAYNGWNYLNFIVEELQNPKRNLPLAIAISLVTVTVIYVLTNIAFYTVVSGDEMLDSDAVAISFAAHLYGSMAWIMPIFVACSTMGSANGCILTSSRLFHSGAREGQMPQFLTLVSYQRLTPIPAVALEGFLSVMYLTLSDNVYALITVLQIVNWLAIAGAMASLFWLRKKQPNTPRPIKVNLVFVIIFTAGCIFLVVVPLVAQPKHTLIGIALMLTSVPVYFVFIKYNHKLPKCVNRYTDAVTLTLQKGLLGVPEKGD